MKYTLIVLFSIVLAITGGCTSGETNQKTNGTTERHPTDDAAAQVDDLTRYANEALGVSLLHPTDARITSPTENRISIKQIGPGSEPGTEITDGFLVTIFRDPAADAFDTLQAYAQTVVADNYEPGDVTESLAPQTISGYDAYRFRAQTALGTHATHYLFLPADGVGFQVTITLSDPRGRGYHDTVRAMLESLTFTDGTTTDTDHVQIALLDYPAVGDAYTRESDGEKRGCDRVVWVDREIPQTGTPLTAALDLLFSLDETTVAGWQNFIARINDTLTFRRATVEKDTAHIYLEGALSGLGGVCDNPRAAIQIEETALRVTGVETVQLYLNGEPTDLQPDARGQ